MKFKMNNVEYTIKEVSQQEYKELRIKEDEEDGVEISDVKNGIYQGSTYYTKGIIYIDKNLPHEIKRKTLIHELTHCYIREYITHEEKNYSEEMVADISANSHDIIHKIVEDYFIPKNHNGGAIPEIRLYDFIMKKQENDEKGEMKNEI